MPVDSIPVQWTLRGVVVRLPDEIDATNSGQVHIALTDALDAAPAILVADMTRTAYCCSEGLRVLIETHRAAQRAGTPLRIAGVSTRVGRILMLTGTNELLDVYASTEAALAQPTAQPTAWPAGAGTEAGGQD